MKMHVYKSFLCRIMERLGMFTGQDLHSVGPICFLQKPTLPVCSIFSI